MPRINIIFPIAGDGSRFNYKFKPFLYATEKRFIELAKEPFNILNEDYSVQYIFIFREDHNNIYNVQNKLNEIFPNDKKLFCILPTKTQGPLETLQYAINNLNLTGPSFVCDCDHSININPIKNILQSDIESDIIIPVWNIKEDNFQKWGKVVIDKYDNIQSFYEKQFVPFSPDYTVKGLIGCYYFRNIAILLNTTKKENISDFLVDNKDTLKYKISYISEAYFFGDQPSLETFRADRAKKMTIFIDLDGTIIKQNDNYSVNSKEIEVLPGSLERLNNWKNQGHTIVITTGRPIEYEEQLIIALTELNIPYDRFITGLPSGPRLIINDKKPYNSFIEMASAVQLPRNKGISDIKLDSQIEILHIFNGASFAKTCLIKLGDNKVVRKYIYKSNENVIHYDQLKRQYEDLIRFNFYSPGFAPKMLSQKETHNEYWYDLEYLEGYMELSKYNNVIKTKVLYSLIDKLKTDVYCYSKNIDGIQWLDNYMNEKIFVKYDLIAKYGDIFNNFIYGSITINNVKYNGIKSLLGNINIYKFIPNKVHPIHGDLTFENILYNETINDFKVIDMAGAKYMDVKEADLAKLLQSIVSKYESWQHRDRLVTIINNDTFIIDEEFLHFENDLANEITKQFDTDLEKGLFYLALYWIRMTPFMIVKGTEHATLGLILCILYLNNVKNI
jgi:hypothetical protein